MQIIQYSGRYAPLRTMKQNRRISLVNDVIQIHYFKQSIDPETLQKQLLKHCVLG